MPLRTLPNPHKHNHITNTHTLPTHMKSIMPKACTQLLLALLPLLTIACQQSQAPVQHSVYVWMKEPGHSENRNTLIETTHRLKEAIPEIRSLAVGIPLPPDRPIVVDDYDIGFIMGFDSVADLHTYEKHPFHVQMVNEIIRPLAAKIVVYDFIDPNTTE